MPRILVMAFEFSFEYEHKPIVMVVAIPLLFTGISFIVCYQPWHDFIHASNSAHSLMVWLIGTISLAWHFGGCFFVSGTKHKWLLILVALICVAPASFILPQLPFLFAMLEYPILALGPRFWARVWTAHRSSKLVPGSSSFLKIQITKAPVKHDVYSEALSLWRCYAVIAESRYQWL